MPLPFAAYDMLTVQSPVMRYISFPIVIMSPLVEIVPLFVVNIATAPPLYKGTFTMSLDGNPEGIIITVPGIGKPYSGGKSIQNAILQFILESDRVTSAVVKSLLPPPPPPPLDKARAIAMS